MTERFKSIIFQGESGRKEFTMVDIGKQRIEELVQELESSGLVVVGIEDGIPQIVDAKTYNNTDDSISFLR